MKRSFLVLVLVLACARVAQAAEKTAEAPASASPAAPAASLVESEKARDWKSLQAQEQWVARLKKQIEGESGQLAEMRGQIAQKYKLDPKKFEAAAYTYDEKTDAFIER